MTAAGTLRSWLFVPGDSERKQTKAVACAADALILDLEDSVAPSLLPAARGRIAELLKSRADRSRQQLWVRVNSLASGLLPDDLRAVFAGEPDGIVLPKVSSPAELVQIGNILAELEKGAGRTVYSTRLLVIATETPRAVLALGSYPSALEAHEPVRRRLAGLTWGSEDLSAALGVTRKTDEQGELTFTFQLARSLCVLTAASIQVQAIDGIYPDFRDSAGLGRNAQTARRDGFSGKLAIHPDQVEPINAAFVPGATEVRWAQRIVEAFEKDPGAGVLSLDGQMIDRPHLNQARRILSMAAAREV